MLTKRTIAAMLLCCLIVCIIPITGCELPEIDDSEERTYRDTVYDYAYLYDAMDGLRSKVYIYYLFCESEHKVLKCVHNTAGSGRTTIKYGIYEGSCDSAITVTIEDETTTFTFSDSNVNMYEDGEDKKYIRADVSHAIYKIELWD